MLCPLLRHDLYISNNAAYQWWLCIAYKFQSLEFLRTSYSYRELFNSRITFAIREFYSLIVLIDVLQAVQ